jgi:hypothetical protein
MAMLASRNRQTGKGARGLRRMGQAGRAGWALACVVAVGVIACVAQKGQQPAPSPVEKPDQVSQQEQQGAAKAPEASDTQAQPAVVGADAAPKTQLASDSARLLKLANDLKAEVDKSNKDMLSLTVIRKADEIEKLARAVKEQTKLVSAAN